MALANEDGTKYCNRCKTTQPVANYHRLRTAPDGLAKWCRSCRSAYDRARGTKPGGPAKAARTKGALATKAKREAEQQAAAANTKEN